MNLACYPFSKFLGKVKGCLFWLWNILGRWIKRLKVCFSFMFPYNAQVDSGSCVMFWFVSVSGYLRVDVLDNLHLVLYHYHHTTLWTSLIELNFYYQFRTPYLSPLVANAFLPQFIEFLSSSSLCCHVIDFCAYAHIGFCTFEAGTSFFNLIGKQAKGWKN